MKVISEYFVYIICNVGGIWCLQVMCCWPFHFSAILAEYKACLLSMTYLHYFTMEVEEACTSQMSATLPTFTQFRDQRVESTSTLTALSQFSKLTHNLTQVVTLLICIQEISDSNLRWDTDCHNQDFSWIFLVSPSKHLIV
jgi:hypothetical protein